jgi:hypothetical protein
MEPIWRRARDWWGKYLGKTFVEERSVLTLFRCDAVPSRASWLPPRGAPCPHA